MEECLITATSHALLDGSRVRSKRTSGILFQLSPRAGFG
jgi:hypothetical protein